MLTGLQQVEALLNSSGTYIIDAENTAELARLLHHGQLVTQAMGGPLPELTDVSACRTFSMWLAARRLGLGVG